MAVDGIHKLTLSRKAGETLSVSTRFSLSMENERIDRERDGRTSLARSNSHARTETENISFSC